MLDENVVKEAYEFLDYLCEETYSFKDFLCHPDFGNMRRFRKENDEGYFDVGVACGATRLCLWDINTEDFVIKIQYNTEDNCDYCANEYGAYLMAKEKGFDNCFAECKKISYHSVDVYLYEFVEADGYALSDESLEWHYQDFCDIEGLNPNDSENRDRYWDEYGSMHSEEEGMLDFACSEWGTDLKEDVESFLDELEINDLHAGNWGRRSDGQLIIIDYAGYGHNLNLGGCV